MSKLDSYWCWRAGRQGVSSKWGSGGTKGSGKRVQGQTHTDTPTSPDVCAHLVNCPLRRSVMFCVLNQILKAQEKNC